MAENKKGQGFIVAIDGPAGAGKSTVSRKLAELLKGKLLDTGSMYRAVAYYVIKSEVDTAEQWRKTASAITFEMDPLTGGILVNGSDLGPKIRSEQVGLKASLVSQDIQVRKILTSRQRALAKKWSRHFPIVVEGRDIGTVVFPKVRFKFFVTARQEIRARRRYDELKRHGVKGVKLASILRQQAKRDDQDSGRRVAPLRCPKDAVVVDTSEMEISQVVQFMASHMKARDFPER